MLWLRCRRRCSDLYQKDKQHRLCGGRQAAGPAGRYARTHRGRQDGPSAQPHPHHEQGRGPLLPRLPQLHRGGGPAGPCLLAAARPRRQDHQPLRAGLCPRRRAGALPAPARQGLQPAGTGRQRPVQAEPVGPHLLPVLAAGHDPHLRSAGKHHRLRRPCAGRLQAQVCQQPRDAGLPQVGHGVRAPDRKAERFPSVRPLRGLHGCHLYASGGHRHRRLCLRHGPDARPDQAHQPVCR